MWEYGADTRGVAAPTALLEINAARYPDKPAVTEYRKNSIYSVSSFRMINCLANKTADYLAGKRFKRGTRVKLNETDNKTFALSDIMGFVSGIIKSGCVFSASENEEDITKIIDVQNILSDDIYSVLAPEIDVLPDEPSFIVNDDTVTGRMMTERAEHFRRRLWWNAADKLLISGLDIYRCFITWISALSLGNETVFASESSGKELKEIIVKENCTIAVLGPKEFERLLLFAESQTRNGGELNLGICRVILADGISDELIDRWESASPDVAFGGIGYEGKFCYDGEWYI